jgi:hypothetical protein
MSLIRNAHAFLLSELPKRHTVLAGAGFPSTRKDRHELLTQHANTGWVIVAHAQLSDLLFPRYLAAYSSFPTESRSTQPFACVTLADIRVPFSTRFSVHKRIYEHVILHSRRKLQPTHEDSKNTKTKMSNHTHSMNYYLVYCPIALMVGCWGSMGRHLGSGKGKVLN